VGGKENGQRFPPTGLLEDGQKKGTETGIDGSRAAREKRSSVEKHPAYICQQKGGRLKGRERTCSWSVADGGRPRGAKISNLERPLGEGCEEGRGDRRPRREERRLCNNCSDTGVKKGLREQAFAADKMATRHLLGRLPRENGGGGKEAATRS